MSTPDNRISEAERRLEAERDRLEISPAQPEGPSRIDDDGLPPGDEPAHVKHEGGDRLEH